MNNTFNFRPSSIFERECLGRLNSDGTFCKFYENHNDEFNNQQHPNSILTYIPHGINSKFYPQTINNLSNSQLKQINLQENEDGSTGIPENREEDIIETIQDVPVSTPELDSVDYESYKPIIQKPIIQDVSLFSNTLTNLTYLANITSRESDFVFNIPKNLFNVTSYELIRLSCNNNQTIINNENNTLKIIDNLTKSQFMFDYSHEFVYVWSNELNNHGRVANSLNGPWYDTSFSEPISGGTYIIVPIGGILTRVSQYSIVSIQGNKVYISAVSQSGDGQITITNPDLPISFERIIKIDNGVYTNEEFASEIQTKLNQNIKVPYWQSWDPSEAYTVDVVDNFLRITLSDSNTFKITDSLILENIGIPMMQTFQNSITGTYPINLTNYSKKLCIFVNDEEECLETIYYSNFDNIIKYSKQSNNITQNTHRNFQTIAKTNQLHIKLTSESLNSELFNLNNSNISMTIAIKHTNVRN